MHSFARIGLGVAVAAGLGAGGYFVASSVLSKGEETDSQSQDNASKPKTTDANTSFTALTSSSFSEDGMVGKIYYKYLVDSGSNQDVWNGLHERYAQDLKKPEDQQPKDKFSNGNVIAGAFSSENIQTTLNKVCDGVYKEKIAKGDSDDGVVETGGGNWKGLWRYCSVYDPKFLEKPNGEEGNTIKDKAKGQLLSADNDDNRELWDAKNTDFFNLTTEPTSKYFKALYDTKNQGDTKGKLKDKCKAAYSEQDNQDGEDKPKLDDVLKYCSMQVIAQS